MTAFRCWMLFLVNAAANLLSVVVAGISSKTVCSGDSVQVYHDNDFDHCNSHVVLKINGKRDAQIASWSHQNCTKNATLAKEYKDRVFLDQNGTVMIHNFSHFDQGTYVVNYTKDALQSVKEMQINIMSAPKNDCKPTVYRLGNTIFASLKDGDCGTPVPTLYWKGYEGVSDTNEPILTITPGTESRTYYACIQSPALQCAKSQMPLDNCSPFMIEGNTSPTVSSESSSTVVHIVSSESRRTVADTVPSESSNTVLLIGVIIALVAISSLAIVAIVILLLILKRRRSNHQEQTRYTELNQTVEMEPLLPETQTSTVANESDVEMQHLSRGAEPSTAVIASNDPTPRTEKATTKREEIGPYGDCCTFCGQGRKAMFILSCEHFGHQYMPACFECGNSYLPCKRCRALHTHDLFR